MFYVCPASVYDVLTFTLCGTQRCSLQLDRIQKPYGGLLGCHSFRGNSHNNNNDVLFFSVPFLDWSTQPIRWKQKQGTIGKRVMIMITMSISVSPSLRWSRKRVHRNGKQSYEAYSRDHCLAITSQNATWKSICMVLTPNVSLKHTTQKQ